MNTYSEKLLDPRWQKLRLEVLNRDKFTCQNCQDTTTTLHIHHLAYKGKNPWETPIELLKTLCAPCHNSETINRPIMEKHLLRAIREAGFLFDDIARFTEGFEQVKIEVASECTASVIEYMLKNKHALDAVNDIINKEIRENSPYYNQKNNG